MRALNVDHPFLRPMWRRIVIVLLCLVWSVVEWTAGSPFWAVLASALTVYALWALILFPPASFAGPPEDQAGPDGNRR